MIWLDESQYCLRIIDGDPAHKPSYRAVGNIYLHGDVAILCGFHGKLLRVDLRDLVSSLWDRGIRHLLTERSGSHRIPMGQRIDTPDGPFHDWWHVDLKEIGIDRIRMAK